MVCYHRYAMASVHDVVAHPVLDANRPLIIATLIFFIVPDGFTSRSREMSIVTVLVSNWWNTIGNDNSAMWLMWMLR